MLHFLLKCCQQRQSNGNTWKTASSHNPESKPCVSDPERLRDSTIRLRWEKFPMLMTRERRPVIRTLRGWAINVLNEAGAIRECEHHGWMQDRADPHARERAIDMAREDPPPGVSPQSAAIAIAEVLDSIGDTCPECPPPD